MNIEKKFLYSEELETKNIFELGSFAGILPLLKKLDEGKIFKLEYLEEETFRKCKGKVCFRKKEAETRRNELRHQGIWMREYRCERCDYWHLTHKIDLHDDKEFKKKLKIKK